MSPSVESVAPRRYAVCGLSNRGLASFVLPLLGLDPSDPGAEERAGGIGFGEAVEDLSSHGDVVAILDPDRERVAAFNDDLLPEGRSIAWYPPDRFDEMVAEARPDAVIVTSPDSTHVDHILAALDHGLDVITEKPMTASAEQARRVLAAEQASVGTVRVTHNLRYTQRHQQIKEMVATGMIGRPLQVLLDYHVDRVHGASYFLRWNRERDRSGGLSVHKSTHHIDLVSWWLGKEPISAYARGGLGYYGAASPHRPRDDHGAPLSNDQVRSVDPYYQAQQESGSFPEQTGEARTGMFGLGYGGQYPRGQDDYLYDAAIDIEDHFSALIAFPDGANLSYMINFSSEWEGYHVTLVGTHGQIEAGQGRRPDGTDLELSSMITYRPLFGEPQTFEVQSGAGGHGGADPLMRHDLFVGPTDRTERLRLAADARQGAVAVAAGEAIWRSIASGGPVAVADLLQDR